MITVNLRYTGKGNAALDFAKEMTESGTVAKIRAEAINAHHASPMMATIAALREKYDLHMTVERFLSDESGVPDSDKKFIRN